MDLSFLTKLNKEIGERFDLFRPVSDINPDGSIHRFDSTKDEDKAIWVAVHANDYKGNTYLNAVYGNWRQGVQFTCSSYDPKEKQFQSKEFKKSAKEQVEKTKQKLDLEKQAKYKACRDKWTPYYYGLNASSPLHDYLKNKIIIIYLFLINQFDF